MPPRVMPSEKPSMGFPKAAPIPAPTTPSATLAISETLSPAIHGDQAALPHAVQALLHDFAQALIGVNHGSLAGIEAHMLRAFHDLEEQHIARPPRAGRHFLAEPF